MRRRRPRGSARTGRRSRRVASRGASRGASRSRRVARSGVADAAAGCLEEAFLGALVAAGARRAGGFKTREQRLIHVVAHLRTRAGRNRRVTSRAGGIAYFVLGNKIGKKKRGKIKVEGRASARRLVPPRTGTCTRPRRTRRTCLPCGTPSSWRPGSAPTAQS